MEVSTIKVLLVEDDESDAMLVKRALSKSSRDRFEVERVDHLEAGLGRLADGGIDVVVLDLSLPDARGLEGFTKVREAAPDVPVVVLTGTDDSRMAARAVGDGQDYLVKDLVDPESLSRAARYAIERQRLLAELRQMTLLDELTGLYNRRGLITLGEQEIKVSERGKMPFLLLFLDVDDFKRINDTFGHAEGDRALTEAAGILRRTLRETDIIARIGGDEFCVLSVGSAEGAEVEAERLKSAFENRNQEARRPYALRLSVGTALFDTEQPCTMEELLDRADRAMYERKQAKDQIRP